MRSYGQYCAAARALDLVGDRWSLLVVRELLLRDCRFTDLQRGLPGIATNLLTERLRQLEAAGVLERHAAPPPVATTLYRLTDRGRELKPVLDALVRWGLPEMVRGAEGDVTRGHWAAGALPILYEDADLRDLAGLRIGVEADGDPLGVEVTADGTLVLVPGALPDDADVVVRGPMDAVIAVLAGRGDEDRVELEGSRRRLSALTRRARLAPAA